MDSQILVGAAFSSIDGSDPFEVPVQSSKQSGNSIPQDDGIPPEHARFSNTLHTKSSGSYLLRVINHGTVIELSSLTSKDRKPLRFHFFDAVLSNPAMFMWQAKELHLVAVTTIGSLFRIVVSIAADNTLWVNDSTRAWCREHRIRSIDNSVTSPPFVHVQGVDCIVLGWNNGTLVRLETDYIAERLQGLRAH